MRPSAGNKPAALRRRNYSQCCGGEEGAEGGGEGEGAERGGAREGSGGTAGDAWEGRAGVRAGSGLEGGGRSDGRKAAGTPMRAVHVSTVPHGLLHHYGCPRQPCPCCIVPTQPPRQQMLRLQAVRGTPSWDRLLNRSRLIPTLAFENLFV